MSHRLLLVARWKPLTPAEDVQKCGHAGTVANRAIAGSLEPAPTARASHREARVPQAPVLDSGAMHRAALVLTLAVLGLVAGAARAEEPAGPLWAGLKGQATIKHFSFFDETPTDNRHHRDEVVLLGEWERRLVSWAHLRLVGIARGDSDDYTEGVRWQIPETSRRRSILDLKEGVLRLWGQPVELTVGKQIYAWGTADAFNPTDNLNPYDHLDVLDTEKLAVWSVAARGARGATSLTLVVVPVFTPSRTPLPGSRWNPPPPPGVVVADRDVPEAAWENVQFAARLRTTVRGWDLSVSYFEGFDDLPEVRVDTVAGPGGPVPRVTPVFPRVRVPGADFSTTVGPVEVHGEGAFRIVDADGRADRFEGIVGINYTWEADWRWLQQVGIVAEYANAPVLAVHRASGIIDAPGLGPAGFRNALVGRLTLKFTEETQLRFTAIVDFDGPVNHYTQAKVTHKVTDALHVEAGLDFLTGERDTFWGRFRESDRFFASVKYFF
jgi:hypothetical protein